MKNYTIRRYAAGDYDSWNAFTANAKNATFLFHRDFMEYHADRFEDCSLMVLDDSQLVSILPANRSEDVLYSHQGLTYGGLVFNAALKGSQVDGILDELMQFLRRIGITKMIIKPIISIYNKQPSHELECFLLNKGATLYRRDLNLAIDYSRPFTISGSKLKHFRRVSKLGMEIREEQNFDLFWEKVLQPRLREKHDTQPVHTKTEMAFLCSKFPENIFQYNAYHEGEIVAGITLFNFGNGVKSQYGATTGKGETLRALDFLFITLIEECRNKYSFFDMGTVTENNDAGYNKGLLKQKEELGCSIFNQDFYSLEL